jgi:hypothetical protein
MWNKKKKNKPKRFPAGINLLERKKHAADRHHPYAPRPAESCRSE